MVIFLMGAAGAGKTTVGMRLAKDLGWVFYDGDSFHPAVNIAKMRRGLPLTDADREPWLERVETLIGSLITERVNAVVACSALKRRYRERIGLPHRDVALVYLKGDYALLARRVRARRGHFLHEDLMAAQLAILEEPAADEALTLDAAQTTAAIVAAIRAALNV